MPTPGVPGRRGDLILALVVPGEPVGKGRPRVVRAGGFVRTFTPDKTAAWEAKALAIAQAAWGRRPPHEGSVNVAVRAVRQRTQELMRPKHGDGRLLRNTKPDLDNVEKAVYDALVTAGVLADDTYVVGQDGSRSLYCARGEAPRVEIIIRHMH